MFKPVKMELDEPEDLSAFKNSETHQNEVDPDILSGATNKVTEAKTKEEGAQEDINESASAGSKSKKVGNKKKLSTRKLKSENDEKEPSFHWVNYGITKEEYDLFKLKCDEVCKKTGKKQVAITTYCREIALKTIGRSSW